MEQCCHNIAKMEGGMMEWCLYKYCDFFSFSLHLLSTLKVSYFKQTYALTQ